MTLPTSGPISLSQIAGEFGLAASTPFPAGFYGKGGAATSGPLSFADFYGRSGAASAVFTPNGGTVDEAMTSPASTALVCSQPATWTYTGGGVGGTVSIASGATATSISFEVTSAGATDRARSWNVTGVSNGVTREFTVNLTALAA